MDKRGNSRGGVTIKVGSRRTHASPEMVVLEGVTRGEITNVAQQYAGASMAAHISRPIEVSRLGPANPWETACCYVYWHFRSYPAILPEGMLNTFNSIHLENDKGKDLEAFWDVWKVAPC